MFGRLEQLGIAVGSHGRALDFGCGAGRLTQALASRFAHADGVDIARSMIEAAEQLNHCPNVDFHHNTAADLALFGTDAFSFIYSSIVLQHMRSALALGYISDFVRVLSPGGILVFQVAERHIAGPHELRRRLSDLRVKLAIGTRLRARQVRLERPEQAWQMEMHAVPDGTMLSTLAALPCEIIDSIYTNSTADDFNGHLQYLGESPVEGWISRQWTVMKLPMSASPS